MQARTATRVKPQGPGTLTRVRATAALSEQHTEESGQTSESPGWDKLSDWGGWMWRGEEGPVVSMETGSDPGQESRREEVTLPALLLPQGTALGGRGMGGPAAPSLAWGRSAAGQAERASAGCRPDPVPPCGASLYMPTWGSLHAPLSSTHHKADSQTTSAGTSSQELAWGTKGTWLPPQHAWR